MSEPRFTYEDIRSILVDHICVDPADLAADADVSFDALGLDSLTNAELQVVMHEQYGMEIPDTQAHAVETTHQLLACMNLHAATVDAASEARVL